MKKYFFIFLLLFNQYNAFTQMQKIFNIENVNSSYFGSYVSIWGDNVLIGNKYYKYPTHKKHITNIFRKENNKWISSQTFLFDGYDILNNGNAFNTGVLNNGKLIAEDSFWRYENFIQVLKKKAGKYYISDSIYIDTVNTTSYYHNVQKTIFKDWLMMKIYHFNTTPFRSYYIDYFYHFENNNWILKDTFYDNEVIGPRVKSIRCIMKSNFTIYSSQRNLYFIKRKNTNWDLFQKIPFYPSPSTDVISDVSLSPDEKWCAAGKNYLETNGVNYQRYHFLNIYKLMDAKWEQVQSLDLENDEDSLFFGGFINISNDELLVGSPERYKGKGVIYYYKLIDGTWIKKGEIHPPASDTTYGYFGYSIDRYGETVVTGAPRDSTYSYAPGAAYIFQMPARDTIEINICEGDSYFFNDTTINTEGHYSDTLLSSYGVDSVVQLYLTVIPDDHSEIDTLICKEDSLQIGDSVLTNEGNYIIPLKNIFGCDSIVTVNIENYKLDVTDSIKADYGCSNGEIKLDVLGDNPPFAFVWNNNQTTNPAINLASATYYVTITDDKNCMYPMSFIVPDSTPYLIPNAFFPSGQEEINATFKPYTAKDVHILSTEIYDRWGEKVFSGVEDEFWDGTYKGKMQPPGVYLYRIVINSPCGEEVKAGQVVLLR